jgi:hypothetical protein
MPAIARTIPVKKIHLSARVREESAKKTTGRADVVIFSCFFDCRAKGMS